MEGLCFYLHPHPLSLDALGEKLFLVPLSFWWLLSFLTWWLHHSSAFISMSPSSLVTVFSLFLYHMSLHFFLIRLLIIRFKASAGIPEWAHLEFLNLQLQWHLFWIRTHSQVPGVWMWTYLLEGHYSMHYRWVILWQHRSADRL